MLLSLYEENLLVTQMKKKVLLWRKKSTPATTKMEHGSPSSATSEHEPASSTGEGWEGTIFYISIHGEG
jgi:hypothetical protein